MESFRFAAEGEFAVGGSAGGVTATSAVAMVTAGVVGGARE